jgi:AcrR family transcriptional regulator
MAVADRISQRSVAEARSRAEREVRALLDAAFTVLGRAGIDGLTVAEVLNEAGLSTRAFYRHFPTKDDLVLALFATESERAAARHQAALDLDDPARALGAWIDGVLALAYEPRRARRTRVLRAEGARLRRDHPTEFTRILGDELTPLVTILRAGTERGDFAVDIDTDPAMIHAIVWSLAESRLDGGKLDRETARATARRWVFGAITRGHPD